MRTLRRSIALVMLAAGVSLSGVAQGDLIFSYHFTNSGETVGPADVVTMHALLTNDPASTEHLLGLNTDFTSINQGTFFFPYAFTFTTNFIGLDLAPGDSFPFDFGTFTPSPAPVPPGTYTIGGSAIGFKDLHQQPISVVGSNLFSATVVQAPEPATLALLGLALAGMGIARRRKLN